MFIWDNLGSQHSVYVTQAMAGRCGPCRFNIVLRPQYQPKQGPIEYSICDLKQLISTMKEERWDMAYTQVEIHCAAIDIGPIHATFEHYGYKWLQCDTEVLLILLEKSF